MIGEALDQIREHYLQRFVDTFNEYAETEGLRIAHEAAFCDETGNVVVEGELELPARGDLFLIRDGEAIELLQVDTESMLSFEPIEFDWPGSTLTIDMTPFQWNWMQLQLLGLPEPHPWQPLKQWFIRWFKHGDPAEHELLSGIHFMSDPEDHQGIPRLSIDLGTAPTEALEELFDTVAQMGAERLIIGQFDDEE